MPAVPTVPTVPAVGQSDLPSRPLVVTADPALLEEVLRLAAAAAVEPFVVDGPPVDAPVWAAAPLVLVGADQVGAVARAVPRRRPGVLVVTADADAEGLFPAALDLGAERVLVLPDAEAWLVDAFADAAERVVPGRLVAVVGGRGGAGATTLAAALAVTALRAGARTMVVDADPLGGGIDLVLGGEDAAGLRWGQLAGARGRLGAGAVQDALPRVDELTILCFDRRPVEPVTGEAMGTLLDAGLRGHDLVVADLPRRLDEAATVALERATVALLVVPAEVRAAVAASRVVRQLSPHCVDLRLVVRGPAPAGLTADDMAEALAMPLAGAIRAEPGLAGDLERGDPPAHRGKGPLAEFCRSFLPEVVGERMLAGRSAGGAGGSGGAESWRAAPVPGLPR